MSDRCLWVGLVGLCLAGLGPDLAGAVTGAEVVEKVQQSFARHQTFSARFEKQFYWAALGKKQTLRGRIYTSRPNQFRLETEGGDLVVADGQAIWVYDRKNQQVVVSPYAAEVKTPWEMLVDYQSQFVPGAAEEVRLDGRPCYLIALQPGDPSSEVVCLRIWVGIRDSRLAKVEQVETGGDIATYLFREYRVDVALDKALFRFEVPAGVQVIDRRDPRGGGG